MTVDIAMPFYGDPALFRLAVESVLAQTDDRWRLVVIDDLYPDLAPGEWVRDIEDPRVVYVRNHVNLGVAGNFNRSIELAEADYLTIMGCDDLLLPDYVARMHRLLEEFGTVDYIQPGVEVVDADGAASLPLADRVKRWYAPKLSGPEILSGAPLARSLVRGNWTYFPSICWRRATVEPMRFDDKLGVALDLDLQLRIIDAGGRIVADDEPTFSYRRHGGSVSAWTANDGSRFDEERAVLKTAGARARQRGWLSTARAARFRLSSRLSALTRLPDALRARDASGVGSLLRHAFLA